MNDRRRPRTPAKPKPAPQLTGPVQLDDDTRNALILFNARLVAQEELEREKRRVDKASKAKDEAAATVRRLDGDPKATAEQKAEAQAAYLASLDALNRAKAGEPATGETRETREAAEAETDGDDATPDEGASDTAESAAEPTDDDATEPTAEADSEHDTVDAEAAGADTPQHATPDETTADETTADESQ